MKQKVITFSYRQKSCLTKNHFWS